MTRRWDTTSNRFSEANSTSIRMEFSITNRFDGNGRSVSWPKMWMCLSVSFIAVFGCSFYLQSATAQLVTQNKTDTVRSNTDAQIKDHQTATAINKRRAFLTKLRQSVMPATPGDLALVIEQLDQMQEAELDDAVVILGSATDKQTCNRLMTLALSRRDSLKTRRVVLIALGDHHTQLAAGTLVQVLHRRYAKELRVIAYQSLIRLTGIDNYTSDFRRWSQWWAANRKLTSQQWQQQLLANFAKRNRNTSKQLAIVQDRLLLALRQRYRAAPADQKQLVLTSMLADPLDSVRRLSLDLVRDLIVSTQLQETLSQAVLGLLNDDSANIRANSTLLLRDMKSEAAAKIIAKRLAEGKETEDIVVRAYLLMMRQLPHAEAVEPALGLLVEPSVQGEAAGAIIAAIDHNPSLLSTSQIMTAARVLRDELSKGETVLPDLPVSPQPKLVELLGRVGNEEDWNRISQWLTSKDRPVKEAAARAWVESGRSLVKLAMHADDEVIQAIVISAAISRGKEPQTLLTLSKHPPKSASLREAWGRALVAMAAVVDAESVATADRNLKQANIAVELRLQFLSAAIDKRLPKDTVNSDPKVKKPTPTRAIIDLLLMRASVRLESGNSKSATDDLERIGMFKTLTMSAKQKNQFTLIRIRAKLASADLDGVFTDAAPILKRQSGKPNPNGDPNAEAADKVLRDGLLDAILVQADKHIESKQGAMAKDILTRLRLALGDTISSDLESRISSIESKLKASETTTS
jgi:hypothetical protein